MMKKIWKVLAVGGCVVMVVGFSIIAGTGTSHAQLVFPTIALDDVETIAAGMLGLLGAVWALKKALGFLGR